MLLVDDDSFNLLVLTTLLESHKLSYDTVTDGNEAIKKVEQRLKN